MKSVSVLQTHTCTHTPQCGFLSSTVTRCDCISSPCWVSLLPAYLQCLLGGRGLLDPCLTGIPLRSWQANPLSWCQNCARGQFFLRGEESKFLLWKSKFAILLTWNVILNFTQCSLLTRYLICAIFLREGGCFTLWYPSSEKMFFTWHDIIYMISGQSISWLYE